MKKLITVIVLLMNAMIYAVDGALDSSFGTGGIVTTNIENNIDFAVALAVQPDNKLVAAGQTSTGGPYKFAIVRYHASGELDSSFGSGGIVTTAIGDNAFANAIVLQPDGKIVVAGRVFVGGDSRFSLVRYRIDGTLDDSFGSGGIVTTNMGFDDSAQVLILQPDGKFVAGGYTDIGGNYMFALLRYHADGTLDNSFGTGGIVITNSGGADSVRALVLQPDGKLVAAGRAFVGGDYNFVVSRYQADGTLDNSFGVAGVVTTVMSYAWINALVLQPDGKLVAAGQTFTGGIYNFAIVRYHASGELDSSFGSGGIVTTAINAIAYALVLQPDGKLVAAGQNSDLNFVLARYNADGSLDNSFGTNGVVITSIGFDDIAYALVLQPDGKLVAAGYTQLSGIDYGFALARYLNPSLEISPLARAMRAKYFLMHKLYK